MAAIEVCDRCGGMMSSRTKASVAFYLPATPDGVASFQGGNPTTSQVIELCRPCTTDLTDFLAPPERANMLALEQMGMVPRQTETKVTEPTE